MRFKKFAILVVAPAVVAVRPASAAVIAAWDFQTTTNGGTAAVMAPLFPGANTTPKVYVANFGSGTLYLDGSNFSSDFFVPAIASTGTEINAAAGTTVNASTSIGMSTVTSGSAALSVLGGAITPPGPGGVPYANGKSMVFRFSMSGLMDLSISYATQRSGTGFTSQVLEYSTSGAAWSSIGTVSSIQSNFEASAPGVATTSFSGISGLDNADVAYVRVTFAGATSSSGSNRFDNIILSAAVIPAPGALALLGAAGLVRRRRRG